MMADANNEIIYLNSAVIEMFGKAEADIQMELSHFNVESLMGNNLSSFQAGGAQKEFWKDPNSQLLLGKRIFDVVANPVNGEDGELLGIVVEWTDRTAEVAIEKEVENLIISAQQGDLSQRMNMQGKTGFFNSLSQGMNQLLDVVSSAFEDVAEVMGGMAKGDLQRNMSGTYSGMFGKVKDDVNGTINQFRSTISNIRESVDTITSGADDIASGNNNLSSRTEQQASSLEETAAALEELTATVRQNADNAQKANQLSTGARAKAQEGGQVVDRATQAMDEINESSAKIAEIIAVIDEIAFQTNLLALNASVEAARAGEQGRGFSVVATEVKNLAQRSATSAREIKDLIQDSVAKVGVGTDLVKESGQTLKEIVEAVQDVGSIVSEIADASQEQSTGIDQVNKAVTSMDQMTQQNAALAEEASAASVSMNQQANDMSRQVDFFKISNSSLKVVD